MYLIILLVLLVLFQMISGNSITKAYLRGLYQNKQNELIEKMIFETSEQIIISAINNKTSYTNIVSCNYLYENNNQLFIDYDTPQKYYIITRLQNIFIDSNITIFEDLCSDCKIDLRFNNPYNCYVINIEW